MFLSLLPIILNYVSFFLEIVIIWFRVVEVEGKIEVIIDNGNTKQEIILDKNERKILCFKYKDITAIEIIDKDIIRNKSKFLKYDKKYNYDLNKNYLDIENFIIHHPNGQILQYNNEKILAVGTPEKYEFEHNIYTQKVSLGSPVLYFKKSKKRPYQKPRVIGVHNSYDPKTKNNIGTFINILIEELKIGIDNLYNKKEIFLTKGGILEVPPGTHINTEKIYLSKKAKVVCHGPGCVNIGEIIKKQ